MLARCIDLLYAEGHRPSTCRHVSANVCRWCFFFFCERRAECAAQLRLHSSQVIVLSSLRRTGSERLPHVSPRISQPFPSCQIESACAQSILDVYRAICTFDPADEKLIFSSIDSRIVTARHLSPQRARILCQYTLECLTFRRVFAERGSSSDLETLEFNLSKFIALDSSVVY